MNINIYWLQELLMTANWSIDSDDHELNKLNMENAPSRAFLVNKYLLPNLIGMSEVQKNLIKNTFIYALNTFSKREWWNLTHYYLPDVTSNPSKMFKDIFRMLFNDEDWHIDAIDKHRKTFNINDSIHQDRYRYGQL